METKNKSEHTEIFEVIVSIEQMVLNNDVFKIRKTLQKIDTYKIEYMFNYKKEKKQLIIWLLIVLVLLQFGLNYLFPSLNSLGSNFLVNYVFSYFIFWLFTIINLVLFYIVIFFYWSMEKHSIIENV